jgi:hypothetical protein
MLETFEKLSAEFKKITSGIKPLNPGNFTFYSSSSSVGSTV